MERPMCKFNINNFGNHNRSGMVMRTLNDVFVMIMVVMFVMPGYVAVGQEKQKSKMIDDYTLQETLHSGNIGIENNAMSQPATTVSKAKFLSHFNSAVYLTFPESRENSIRLLDDIPQIWTKRKREDLTAFSAKAQPNEYFVFQVGVYAVRQTLQKIKVEYADLTGNIVIPASAFTCFNLEGIDDAGQHFTKEVNVSRGHVQPLWFGVHFPKEAKGRFEGHITVSAANVPPTVIKLHFDANGAVLKDQGFDDDWRLSRLAWLNSTIARNDSITNGYTPVILNKHVINILGRQIKLSDSGLPLEINSFFGSDNEHLEQTSKPILSDGVRFIVEDINGKIITLKPDKLLFHQVTPAKVEWSVTHKAKDLALIVTAYAEFDGFMNYRLKLTAKNNITVKDIRLEVPMQTGLSKYMMGMNKEGGLRPDIWHWKWDVKSKSQDAVWVGSVNGGLRIKLKGANYHRQLVNVYYEFDQLNLPDSWGNGEKGGVDISTQENRTLLKAYSGERTMKKGDQLSYDFELLVTPVKLISKNIQFGDRYYHNSKTDVSAGYIEEAEKSGANIINIHHRKDINPFINYPYMSQNVPPLQHFINQAHADSIRVKVYYTTRELTVNTPEIWAMRSLDGEIIFPGPGKDAKTVINPNGPDQWLTDNFKDNFIPAWKTTFTEGPYKGRQDLSVITTPDSRLNNFYLEGLNWMCKKLGIDGVYIDDSALDHITMQRARKILDKWRPEARIDLHSWNHFNNMAGFACSLNLYMDLFPYIDLLWIGEGRDYNLAPDYWLVEISGIPFGLTSQMLQDGGNRWRGMVFGMTNRLGWYGPTPEYIWKFWDQTAIRDMDMLGFWDQNCPVHAVNPNIVTTVFKGDQKSIIAVANWSDKEQNATLTFDWKKFGLDPDAVSADIPFIKEYQDAVPFHDNDTLQIPGGKGYLIVLEKY